ncbi:MAG: filamentous hemagglutinin N-terminal domain-containing protein, partial [Zoogloeaceae bacterium]|nr:filamentous hemagglutinin N-terminal domain-containing protein [Zoogloeaceae bacterium]
MSYFPAIENSCFFHGLLTEFFHCVFQCAFVMNTLMRYGLWLFLGCAVAAPTCGQIVPDAGVSGQKPVVLSTGGGLPLVHIVTPTAGGVSVNQYRQFDVQAKGVVLNNNRDPLVAAQLGGEVAANPFLAGGAARVIVNQVNSSNPSYLLGPLEIAGKRAELVIANPSGLEVNGAVFLNASRTTLLTGRVNLSNGGLSGYTVGDGAIRIEGAGLDARQSEYTALLARAVEVNAKLHAGHLTIVAGQNEIAAGDMGDAMPVGNSLSAAPAPLFAVDVKALGGMYAESILLVGTEHGVGVKNHG